jgi:hypothetical protein
MINHALMPHDTAALALVAKDDLGRGMLDWIGHLGFQKKLCVIWPQSLLVCASHQVERYYYTKNDQ